MDLVQLSRKQKRISDWNRFLETEVDDDAIRLSLSEQLKAFRNLIAKCWENDQIGEDDAKAISSLERTIEQLVEEARLFAR